jgi:hypothetical protein
MRVLALTIVLLFCGQAQGQSWFTKNFEIDVVDLRVGQGIISNQAWKDGMYGASALDHLDDSRDNVGLKQDIITTKRPFDVEYSFSDLSGYCCGNTNNNYDFRTEIGVKAQLKKVWRLRLGVSLNVLNKAFGDHDSYHLDDTPFGRETLYLREGDKLDVIRVKKGYGPDDFDTTLYVSRTKLAYFAHPNEFIGLGLNGQFVLHESKTKRNHLYVNFSGSFMTTTSNITTIQFTYFDYQRISYGEYGSGHINGVSINPYDSYQIEVEGRKSNRGFDFQYKTPSIHSLQVMYGLEFSRQLFRKFPLTMTLGFGTRRNTFWRKSQTIVTSKVAFYQAGFGWILSKEENKKGPREHESLP